MSRRAGESSSWKAAVASCARWLSAARSISSVSRCAHEDERLLAAPAFQRRRVREEPGEARIGRVRGLGRAAVRFSSGPERRRQRGAGRQRAAHAIGLAGGARPRWARARRARPPRAQLRRQLRAASTGRGARGGRPPMSSRRVELVHGGSGSRAARAAPRSPTSSGSSSGRRSWRSRKNPCASSSSGVAVSRSTCRPSAAIGADRAPGRRCRAGAAAGAGGGPRPPPAGRCRPRPPAP